MDTEKRLREIVKHHRADLIDGVLVDAFTASMLVQVADALNDKNRAHFLGLPIVAMADLGWKLVQKSQETRS